MNIAKKVLIGFLVIIGLIIICLVIRGIRVVPVGRIDVVSNFGKFNYLMKPGMHVVDPFSLSVEEFDTRQILTKVKITGSSKDSLRIGATVSVSWRIKNEDSIEKIFINYGNMVSFHDRVINPYLQSSIKTAMGKMSAEEIIPKRDVLALTILDELQKYLKGYNIDIISPQVENIDFPQSYRKSIEDKEKMHQEVLKEQYTLQRQKLESEQQINTAKAKADATMLAAKAQADAKLLTVKADASAIKQLADAEAYRIQKVNITFGKIKDAKSYLNLKRIEKWNGALPLYTTGNGLLMNALTK